MLQTTKSYQQKNQIVKTVKKTMWVIQIDIIEGYDNNLNQIRKKPFCNNLPTLSDFKDFSEFIYLRHMYFQKFTE